MEQESSKEYPAVSAVQAINTHVNGLLEYGVGPVTESGRNPCEEEILEYGEGHCGMYAYLFAKELSRWQIPCMTLGITASSTIAGTAGHTVVQVETDQGEYVFDPTYGNYYEADIKTLINSGDAGSFKMGTASEETYYQTSRFFEQAQCINAYEDIRDWYDLDLRNNFSQQTVANLPICSQPDDIDHSDSLPLNTVKTTFEEQQGFYRVLLEFVEPVPEDAAFTCTARRADGTEEEVKGFVQRDTYQVNFQAFEQTDALEVEMRIDSGQTLPELIRYTIYQ